MSTARQGGNLVLKTEILDHFHGTNTSIQVRVYKEQAHSPQQPRQLVIHAEGKFAGDEC